MWSSHSRPIPDIITTLYLINMLVIIQHTLLLLLNIFEIFHVMWHSDVQFIPNILRINNLFLTALGTFRLVIHSTHWRVTCMWWYSLTCHCLCFRTCLVKASWLCVFCRSRVLWVCIFPESLWSSTVAPRAAARQPSWTTLKHCGWGAQQHGTRTRTRTHTQWSPQLYACKESTPNVLNNIKSNWIKLLSSHFNKIQKYLSQY